MAFVYVYEEPVGMEALMPQLEGPEAALRQGYEAVAEVMAQWSPIYYVPHDGLLPVGKHPEYGKLILAES